MAIVSWYVFETRQASAIFALRLSSFRSTSFSRLRRRRCHGCGLHCEGISSLVSFKFMAVDSSQIADHRVVVLAVFGVVPFSVLSIPCLPSPDEASTSSVTDAVIYILKLPSGVKAGQQHGHERDVVTPAWALGAAVVTSG